MNKKFQVIALIGSTKFKDYFIRLQKDFTLKGYIVISPCIFSHADPEDEKVSTIEIGKMLDEMCKQRIDMADFVYVINPNKYVGDNTQMEIDYAKNIGKMIKYMEDK